MDHVTSEQTMNTEKQPEKQPLDYVIPANEPEAAAHRDYHEPISRMCPGCWRKHWGAFELCHSCSQRD
jgi:hypothetical protein